ncbi:MAG: hypothetical protein WAV04_01750 [Candidatus Microsaccharimonas sp.]
MKQYIFLKKSSSILNAHLYEHLFYMSIVDYLSSKGLYKYIDYDLVGKTYHGGFVYIELSSYNKLTSLNQRVMSRLDLELNEERVDIALGQVSAEIKKTLHVSNMDSLVERIKTLHAEPWYSIEELDQLDFKLFHDSNEGSIQLGGPVKSKQIAVSIIAKDSTSKNREYIALTRQLYKAVSDNLADTFCDTFGLFDAGDSFQRQTTHRLDTVLLTSDKHLELEDGYELLAKQLINSMVKDGAFARLSKNLKDMSYRKDTMSAVSIESNYEDTLTVIGLKGWKRIATIENIYSILEGSDVVIKMGNTTITIPLKNTVQ